MNSGSASFDCVVIGGGIVGLATAWTLLRSHPAARVALLEKEREAAAHQTGRNSGVIHSGVYYAPGSLKARLARAGNESMQRFCEEHGLPWERCGKLIAATDESEWPHLERLFQRGLQNGITLRRLSPEETREIEPHVRCRAAIHISSTGITSYRAVALKLADLLQNAGGELRFGTCLERIIHRHGEQVLETNKGALRTRFLINCAGLHSDRVARLGGCDPAARIVPFRGEYWELIPERRSLVKHLVYPVPNPAFPFLGVHFTRMIDGSVHAGPNAVLALHREGYRQSDCSVRDLRETLGYPGFWKLASRHWSEGGREMWRSLSKASFVRSLQKLVPEITERDVIPAAAGVRAQALRADGTLVDDFLMVRGPDSLHVCNAPSPAATASLEIAREIAQQVPAPQRTVVAAA